MVLFLLLHIMSLPKNLVAGGVQNEGWDNDAEPERKDGKMVLANRYSEVHMYICVASPLCLPIDGGMYGLAGCVE